MCNPSNHALTRNAQRNLKGDDLDYVTEHGQEFFKAGAIIYILRKCDVAEKDRRFTRYMRLVGTAIIIAIDDGTEITAWRNKKKGLKIIKRKSEHNRPINFQNSFA